MNTEIERELLTLSAALALLGGVSLLAAAVIWVLVEWK